ncbi:MAG: hypothetical protein ACKVVT_15800 [Dehalococcoidia bacterium]
MTAPRTAELNRPQPGDDAVRAFYEQTIRTAFGLAFRITGEREAANQVCEAAYAASCHGGAVSEAESTFLLRVRTLAIEERAKANLRVVRSDPQQPSYEQTNAIRTGLTAVSPLARRALDLAYFGGAGVGEIAELLGEPLPSVRAALREALLTLGASVRQGQENRP